MPAFRQRQETREIRGPSGKQDMLDGLEEFREHLGGRLTIPMIRAPGDRLDVHEMDGPTVRASFEELRQRLAKTIDYVKTFKPAQFEGAETRDVTFGIGGGKTATLNGQAFLSNFSLPNFYFHAATAHGILRHNGVEIGKRDFMGV